MRIILVNKFHYPKGGSETYYFGLADGLRKLGHEVHFFAMQDDQNLPCEDSDLFVSAKDYNGPASVTQKLGEAKSLIYSKESLEKFEKLCERVHPDVVHMNLVHRQITLSILDAPYLKEHNVSVLFTSHDYIFVCPNYLMLDGAGNICEACLGGHFKECLKRKCVKGSTAKSAMAMAEANYYKRHRTYQKIDRIIAPSAFMRDKLIQGGFSEKQVIHMQNFAKDEVLQRARDAYDRTDRERPYVLYLGRLSREKGVDVLVDGFARACGELPEGWRLVVAGDGPERQELEAQVTAAGQAGRIDFVGFQTGGAVMRLTEGASIAVQPSRCRENMPYATVEALSAGTPMVGSRIGGIPEAVIEGETGWLAEPGDVESLATALVRGAKVAQDRAAYHAMQRGCREYVLSCCDQSKYMNELTDLYEDLVSEKGTR